MFKSQNLQNRLFEVNNLACLSLLILMWKQYAHVSSFLAVPLLNILDGISVWYIRISFLILVSSIIFSFFVRNKYVLGLIVITFSLLLIFDANNIYPFTLFEFTIYILFFLFYNNIINAEGTLHLSRWLLLGIYFSGCIQKLNPLFENGIFEWFLLPLRYYLSSSNTLTIKNLSWIIPVWEGLGMLLLIFARTRKLGLFLIISTHVIILFLFSPFYRKVFGPLVFFNVGLIGFVLVLFKDYKSNLILDTVKISNRFVVYCTLSFALLVPSFHYLGFGHAYLSYDLYSGKYKFSSFIIDEKVYKSMPRHLQLKCLNTGYKNYWKLTLDSWVFSETYGSLYRETFVINRFKKFMMQYKSSRGNCVLLLHRNGKREYEYLY